MSRSSLKRPLPNVLPVHIPNLSHKPNRHNFMPAKCGAKMWVGRNFEGYDHALTYGPVSCAECGEVFNADGPQWS